MINVKREQLIKECIRAVYNEYVGGLINITLDYPAESEDYKTAVKALYAPESIKKELYSELIHRPAVEIGFNLVSVEKDIRFFGKKNIESLISAYVDNHIKEDQDEIE